MDCTMPGFPAHHQLPELAQTQVHRVGDAIQPSHPLSSSSPPAFNLAQHQGLNQWVSSSHQVGKNWSFSFSIRWARISASKDWFPLGWIGWISFQSKGLSKSSPTPQFKSINSSMLSFLYGPTLTSKHDYCLKTITLTRWTFIGKVMSLLFNAMSRLS